MYDKLLVRKILEHPETYDWSLQGMGQLRLYLSKAVRLHVWSPGHRFIHNDVMPDRWDGSQPRKPDMIHDHPWAFTSYVIVGSIKNIRYCRAQEGGLFGGGGPFKEQTITCGPGGGLTGGTNRVTLLPYSMEVIPAGSSYHQWAEEIHETDPEPGTVTIIERTFRKDTEHAHVYYAGAKWKSAEPRAAYPKEVREICNLALQRNEW